MKQFTKKLSISILAVVFAMVALGTTTFAWFTVSENALMSSFSADVTAGSGFDISVTQLNTTTGTDTVAGTGLAWYSGNIPSEAMTALISSISFDSDHAEETANKFKHFDAVTYEKWNGTTFAADGGLYLRSPGTGTTPSATASTNNYIQFQIHFRSTDAATIKVAEKTKMSGFGNFIVDVPTYKDSGDATRTTGNTLVTSVANAARLGFFGGTDSPLIYQNKVGDIGGSTAVENFEANTSGYAVAEKGATSYFLAKAQENLTAPTDTSNVKNLLNSTDGDDYLNNLIDLAQISGAGSYYGTITVKVWIEGWDAECYNSIFSQTLYVVLAFSTSNTPAA